MAGGDISFKRRSNTVPWCDISIVDNDVLRSDTLESAANIALLTDRRASVEEITLANLYPKFPYDLRGWFADTYRDKPIGSKLWLNQRRKATDQVLSDHIQYAKESLSFLIDDGIAKDVLVTASWVRRGVMGMNIAIVRTDDSVTLQGYTFLWTEVQNAIY